MKIVKQSAFKNEPADKAEFNRWVQKLESENKRAYESIEIETAIGRTHVWGLNTTSSKTIPLVIFPGARTTTLFWDLDKGLDHFGADQRIFMVETNGLPNLSDGATPDIKSNDYGLWASQVLDRLKIDKAYVAGASFGGLIAMKLALVNPGKIIACFLLNPGCLQPFSLSLKNLYYNILPIVSPSEKNVRKFLDEAVFCKPHHMLSTFAEQMLVDYEVFALKRYKDRTQKPYYMDAELDGVNVDTYLIEGDHDLLFPFEKSIANAKQHLRSLKDVKVFENVGHGIETYKPALQYLAEKIKVYREK